MSKILSPTSQNFKTYGKIIHYPNPERRGKTRNLWRIVHNEPSKVGWRIAYLVLRDKSIGQFGVHPKSDETFEPLKGKALLFVSKDKNLENVKCFKLDKPLIVRKGIWHNLIAIDDEVHIKIVENSNVTQNLWKLNFRFKTYKELLSRIEK